MTRISEERRVVEVMIRLYCRHKEGNATLCADCEELLHYANERLAQCPFGEDKTTCKQCPVHCYRTDMRKRIRTVMRWSGPRMIFYHPVLALKHMWRELTIS